MRLSPKCVWIVVIYCDKSVTKIQQVLLGIFAVPLKLLPENNPKTDLKNQGVQTPSEPKSSDETEGGDTDETSVTGQMKLIWETYLEESNSGKK